MNSKSIAITEITPLSDKDCFYIADRYKTEFSYPLHKHDDYELNFIVNASGVRRIVGDSIEEINDYDLVLIANGNLEHVWEQHKCVSDSIREITIQFSPDLFFSSFLGKTQFHSIKRMMDKAQYGLSFPRECILKVYPLLDKLSKESANFYSVLDFLSIFYELSLFYEKARPLSNSSYARAEVSSDSRRISRVQSHINHSFKENLTLKQLADLVGMSPVSFSRFFKLRTGKSVSDYIIDIRLGNASRLLINSQFSIAEICFESGFNNLSNFNRLFRKKKMCSPKEFRENYRKTKFII
ncbi:MAG: helix-turn-helix domain-containing protein [Leadbetterella sp.]|nr:helix-turn-helix domain-containing protein [Leadbetterella sp.]